jgi:hypothetical protein
MAESGFSRFIPPNLRQPLNELGALAYQLGDNVFGLEDEYDTMGELLKQSLREDPIGTAGSIASGVVDSAKAAYDDPMGTLSALGDEFATAYEMLSTPMAMDASREEVGQRLEAASLLSSVIPGYGAVGAGTKVLGGAAANVVDAARRTPDDAFNVEMNRLLDEEADAAMLPVPAQLAPDPRTADLERLRQLDNEGIFNPDSFGLSLRRDLGEFDDLLSEDDLRNNFRGLLSDDIDGMMSPAAMRSQGVPEEEIVRILARFEALGTRFPDIVEEIAGTTDTFAQVPFVFDEPEFNPNAFDPEEPIDYGDTMPEDFFPGAFENFDLLPDPVQLHPFDERVLRNPIPLPGTLPASRFPDANPYNTDQGFAYSPLTWPSNEGIAGLYSRAARAAGGLKQPAYGDINQLRRELEARGAPPKELDTQMGYLSRLFEESPTGTVSAADVQGMLSNAPGIDVVRTSTYAPIGPPGGQNYTSTVYSHPAADFGPPEAFDHFVIDLASGENTMPPLFHTRAAQYQIAPDGGPATTHHVLEIQSDWAQYRQLVPSTPEKRAQLAKEIRELRDFVSFGESTPEEMKHLQTLEDIFQSNMFRDDFDEQYPAPLIKNENDWVDAGVRQNLLDAVNSGSDWITFGNGSQATEHVGMPEAAAKRFYDQQVPLSVERVLRKLSREAGVEFPELQQVPFVDGQTVRGLRITPELREALIQKGLPSFRDGGMVSDQTSRVGRPLYENPDGSYYSEVTVTFPFEGKWLTFPSVDESGNILSEDEVFDYVKKNGPVDPITGETFPFFETLEDAESFARDRSKGLINFRDGGSVTASEYLLPSRHY